MFDPKDIFKKFGKSARQILITSQRIAQNMNSGLGTEHLLLAMTITSGNLTYDVLKENAINLDQVKLILSINNIKTNLSTGLSKEATEALRIAAEKAQELNHTSIESEHILWAVVNNKECRAYQIISKIGVEPKNIAEELDVIFEEISDAGDLIEKKIDENGLNSFINATGFEFVIPEKFSNKKTNSKTPFLDQFGTDLTQLAKSNKLDPLVGRENELIRTIQILCRRTKNNPVLLGEPGVGKTSIIEGLAQQIALGNVPLKLQNRRIINLDISLAVAGTMYRGQFEDRIKRIIQEVIKEKNIILFIDEIHTVIGAGSAEGSIDAANILKPSLAKGQIHLIGATTIDEYTKHIEKDKALERRFQTVKVNEPNSPETIKILHGIKKYYENHHQVKITDEAIDSAVKLSSRYLTDRFLPDKAIDLIDEASAVKQIQNNPKKTKSKELTKLQKELSEILEKKDQAVKIQDFEKAATYKNQELIITSKIEKLSKKNKKNNKSLHITEIDIAQIISSWTEIPLENLIQTDLKKYLNLEPELKKKIIGQDSAIKSVTDAIKRSKTRISNPARPLGAFIFLGPTGVGKTELVKQLSQLIYANKNSLIKLDMSEFMEKHTVSRIIGAPPGYVGYDDNGKLTEQVRKNPYSIILFDEIEKAHPDIFNILLQILEDGILTDSKGRTVNFKNTIVILTSNIGANQLNEEASIGFKNEKSFSDIKSKYQKIEKIVLEQLKKEFKPELLNRIDDIIVFKPLDQNEIKKIVSIQTNELIDRLKKENIKLEINKDVIDYIAKISFDPKFGARVVRRKITQYIENPLSDKLLLKPQKGKIKVIVKNNQITFI